VVTTDLLGRAQAGDGEAFGQLVDPYRRELQVHCYRILTLSGALICAMTRFDGTTLPPLRAAANPGRDLRSAWRPGQR
jgi:hypothetical protein